MLRIALATSLVLVFSIASANLASAANQGKQGGKQNGQGKAQGQQQDGQGGQQGEQQDGQGGEQGQQQNNKAGAQGQQQNGQAGAQGQQQNGQGGEQGDQQNGQDGKGGEGGAKGQQKNKQANVPGPMILRNVAKNNAAVNPPVRKPLPNADLPFGGAFGNGAPANNNAVVAGNAAPKR